MVFPVINETFIIRHWRVYIILDYIRLRKFKHWHLTGGETEQGLTLFISKRTPVSFRINYVNDLVIYGVLGRCPILPKGKHINQFNGEG